MATLTVGAVVFATSIVVDRVLADADDVSVEQGREFDLDSATSVGARKVAALRARLVESSARHKVIVAPGEDMCSFF